MPAPDVRLPDRPVVQRGRPSPTGVWPTRGDGPHEPAVLVHGLGGNALNWVDLEEALSDRLDCVALDLPGWGKVDRRPIPSPQELPPPPLNELRVLHLGDVPRVGLTINAA